MKDNMRALRRHHIERIKKKIKSKNYHGGFWKSKYKSYSVDRKNGIYNAVEWTEEDREAVVSKICSAKKMCSCEGCGNPRKHFDEKTLQERKAEEDALNQLKEYALREDYKNEID